MYGKKKETVFVIIHEVVKYNFMLNRILLNQES